MTLSPKETLMSRRKDAKQYWEMTTQELRETTKEFDDEFVAEKARPLSPEMQVRWQRAKNKYLPTENNENERTIVVSLEKALLERCTALAKKKRIGRDALIARGLKALLAAEGQG
jgi:hypothetical protein